MYTGNNHQHAGADYQLNHAGADYQLNHAAADYQLNHAGADYQLNLAGADYQLNHDAGAHNNNTRSHHDAPAHDHHAGATTLQRRVYRTSRRTLQRVSEGHLQERECHGVHQLLNSRDNCWYGIYGCEPVCVPKRL